MASRYDTSLDNTPILKTPARQTTASSSNYGQSTGRVSTSHSSSSTCFIVSLLETKARNVGMAALDLRSPTLELCYLADSSSYLSSLSMLLLYDPVEILLPSPVYPGVSVVASETFMGSRITSMPRKQFSEVVGWEKLQNLCFDCDLPVVKTEVVQHKEIVGAAAALLEHVEKIQGISFSNRSLKIKVRAPDGYLLIDPSTSDALEVFRSSTPVSSVSLFSTLNHTQTPMGQRLLKMSLAQPPSDLATIESRVEAVEHLVSNEDAFFALKTVLQGFPDLEFVLSQYSSCPPLQQTSKTTFNIAKTVVLTKQALEHCQSVKQALNTNDTPGIFQAVCEILHDNAIKQLYEKISEVLEDDAVMTRGSTVKTALIFAVRPGISALLDVARQTYVETVEDIQKLVEHTKSEYNLTNLKLHFSAKKGHYLSLPIEEVPKYGTITGYIQNQRVGKRMQFSLSLLQSLNNRSEEALEEVLLMMSQVLLDLVEEVRTLLPVLISISDGIAIIDLLWSFSSFVTSRGHQHSYVKPELTIDGPIAIKDGSHPVLQQTVKGFIPNDFFISDSINTLIIQGINMAGKTTLLRQTSCLIILAHIGCFVPATFSSIPLLHRLVVRSVGDENVGVGDSSFALEMREVAHGVTTSTEFGPEQRKGVLVMIDELGKATSTIDGLGIAWAVTEHLIINGIKSIITSHYPQLSQLSVLYPQARCCHLSSSAASGGMTPNFKLSDGSLDISLTDGKGYGIVAAEMAGFPEVVLNHAIDIRTELMKNQSAVTDNSLEIVRQISEKVSMLRFSTMDETQIKEYLVKFQQILPTNMG
ncbi:hypothetical protein GEMRC1_011025 [Eukaryota sp. GEM-RC1]